MVKASEVFTPEEQERIKFILKLFNGKIVKLVKNLEAGNR